MKDSDVAERFRKALKSSKRGCSSQWDNTRRCQAFYVGDTSTYGDKIQYATIKGEKKRALIQFNKVMPYVDAVGGFMAQNRRQVKYLARLPKSQKQQFYTKYSNAVAGYIREHANADQLETEQDNDMLINGYGAVDTDISYIQGNATICPNGEILMARLDPLTTFWDSSAKRKNISDRRWCGYWQDYDLDDALALFSKSDAEDFESVDELDTEKYYYNPQGGKYDKTTLDEEVEWAEKDQARVRVYNFQWFEYESFWQADNPIYQFQNPEAVQLAAMQLKQLADEHEADYPDMFKFDPLAKVLTLDKKLKAEVTAIFGKFIKPVEFTRKRFHTAVISGKHVFTSFTSVSQIDYSIQFKTGTYDAVRKIWIGMVNNMMEPQLYYNKSLTELMFTIASNSKGGVMVEKGAVEDIQEFEEKYASTTAVMEVEDGALSGGKILPKGNNVPTTGLDAILQLTDASIADASGVDKSFLGSAENKQETGILFKRRIRQVVSTMAKYFDSVTLYQKTQGRIMLDFIRVWCENNQGLEIELVEMDGSYDIAQINADPFLAEFGVTIQEAPETPEDEQEKGDLLSTMGDKLIQFNPKAASALYLMAAKRYGLDADEMQEISAAMQDQGPQIDPAQYKQLQDQVYLLSSQTNQADVEEKMANAAFKRSQIPVSAADIELKHAQAQKQAHEAHSTLETAHGKNLENHNLKTFGAKVIPQVKPMNQKPPTP